MMLLLTNNYDVNCQIMISGNVKGGGGDMNLHMLESTVVDRLIHFERECAVAYKYNYK